MKVCVLRELIDMKSLYLVFMFRPSERRDFKSIRTLRKPGDEQNIQEPIVKVEAERFGDVQRRVRLLGGVQDVFGVQLLADDQENFARAVFGCGICQVF